MEYVPVMKSLPPELAGIRVNASSFREASHLIADCLELRTSAAPGKALTEAIASWEREGRPVRREDGVVADQSQWRYRFDPQLKAWLRQQVETLEHELAALGYPTDNCNQLDGLPRYDGDAIVITVTGVNPTSRAVPTLVLGLRVEHPGAPWTYLSAGATVPTVVHPTLSQALDRVRDLARGPAAAPAPARRRPALRVLHRPGRSRAAARPAAGS